MSEHPKEEELIAYREGEPNRSGAIANHLNECAECRAEMEKIEVVFAAMDAMPAPDPGEDYESRVWRQISPRLAEKPPPWWEGFLAPRRLAVVGTMAALIIAAFVVGRWTKHPPRPSEVVAAQKVRERVLIVAVGQHLGKSEMVLMELENAPPAQPGQRLVNISAEQRRAEDLVEENRLYRQTALKQGDHAMASTLDELERVLLDIANSPQEVTPAQFQAIRERIEARGILFKVRVVSRELLERQKAAKSSSTQPSPARGARKTRERNKT